MAELKNRTRITITIKNELLKKFRTLSENTRIHMSKLLDEAIQDLLKKHKV